MGPSAEAARIDLTVEAPVGVADVRVDDMRLHQVLLNLVSNAIKYNRKNGSVRVTAEDRQDGRVRFLVTDTGLGISAEHRTQLFEPFHRLGQERSGIDGTGIGLSICKRLTEAMGGSIGLDSTPGEGSTFWVEFAADAAPAWQPAAIDRSDMVPKAPASRFSLLYVEDNPSNMRLMQELVAVLPGVAMLSAETPEKGLELARAHRPDVILLDLNLPGMSGYEVLAHLQAMPETSAIPAIAVTAAAMPEDVERGYAAGFTRYLTKPIDAKEFLAAICDCIPFDEADETPIEVAAAD
jgi:CheY-like chemotaxis protein